MRKLQTYLILVAMLLSAVAASAANVKTSELPSETVPDTDDFLMMVQNEVGVYTTVKVSVADFVDQIGLITVGGEESQWFVYTFTIPDEPNDGAQHFHIQIDDDSDFSSPVVEWDTRPGEDGTVGAMYFNGTQWEDWPESGVTAAYEGESVCYSFISESIVGGAVYFVRFRFHDGIGFGDWVGDAASTALSTSAGEVATWGAIIGTLADQTDLVEALAGKQTASANLTLWANLTPSTLTIDAGNVTSGTLGTDRYSAYSDLSAEGRIGTAAGNVSAGDHTHSGVYQSADAGLSELAGIAVETAANGTLLIGDGTGMTLATLTAGANVSITVGAGSIEIAGNTTAASINAQGLDDELTDVAGLSPTLGYLIVGNSTAFIALAPGANGTVLTSDSAQASGLTYAAARAPLAAVRHVFWPAGAAITMGNATAATVTTANVTYDTFDMDSATDEAIMWTGYLEHWNLGAIKVFVAWTAASSTGNITFGAAALSYADSDVLDTAPGTSNITTDTLLTAGDLHKSPGTTITVGGTPGAGEPIVLKLYRDADGGEGSDTLGADGRVLGVWLEYTESATEEAAW